MKIVFTGGGTAGHISLNLALIPYFIEKGYEVHYIGSKYGMEKDWVSDIDKVYDTYEHIDEFKKNMDNQNELGNIEDVVNKIIELQK